MCGILAYIPKEGNATQITLSSLKKLEYRGYDSWGIGIIKKKTISIYKYLGQIDITKHIPESEIAVGHTRWATNGTISLNNCHPFTDCRNTVFIVHNGIVENADELKDTLSGHNFKSETDSEIIVHLIEEHLKTHTFYDSVNIVFGMLDGINAIIAVHKNGEIVGRRNTLPLIVGIADDGYFISSDINSFIEYTNRVIKISSDDRIHILNNNLHIYNDKNKEIFPEQIVVDNKATFFSEDLFEEIAAQKYIFDNIKIDERIVDLLKLNRILFIGSGTSYNACEIGEYLFNKHGINSIAVMSSEFKKSFLRKDDIVLAISQSGETADIIEAVFAIKKNGNKIIAITNNSLSSLYSISDYRILMNIGNENAVIGTKTFTSTLAILCNIIRSITKNKTKNADFKNAINNIFTKESLKSIEKIANKIHKSKYLMIIGKGINHIISKEAALKIKESLYIPCDGTSAGEMKHWAIAMIEKDTPVIVFYTEDCAVNVKELKSRKAKIIGISNENNKEFDHFIQINLVEETFILNIIVIHLLIYYMSKKLHIDPRRPRNLAKTVTVR